VRRNRKLTIDWGESQGLKIEAEFGDTRREKDAIERLAEITAKAMSGLQEIGLWIVLFLVMLVGVTQVSGYASQRVQSPQVLAVSHCGEPFAQGLTSATYHSTCQSWLGNATSNQIA